MTNSATGGYLAPTSKPFVPRNLNLEQFIQSVIVGITSYPGTLVRPKWQAAPPKQPDLSIDWIAYGISIIGSDANAYVWLDSHDVTNLNRQESIEVQCAFYGPHAIDNITIFRDGFQIQQNLDALRFAKMGFKEISPANRGPDLVNERWVERYETTLILVRQVLRSYPILSFASASGTIHTVIGNDPTNLPWQSGGV